MTEQCNPETNAEKTISNHLGTFEGFNFRNQCAIPRILTAEEVVNWDHDSEGEAEFWPAGDRPEISVVFNRSTVTATELLDLDRLLTDLGGDSTENFLRVHYAVNICGADIANLDSGQVEDHNLHLFIGLSFIDLRKEAAYELFELYHPEDFRVWDVSTCDGLIFDVDRFLGSPVFFVEEVVLGDRNALLVASE